MPVQDNKNYRGKKFIEGYTTLTYAALFLVPLSFFLFYTLVDVCSHHRMARWHQITSGEIAYYIIGTITVFTILILLNNHKVPIGNIGIYMINGAVLDKYILLPGWHFKLRGLMNIQNYYDNDQIRGDSFNIENIICQNNIPVKLSLHLEWSINDAFKVKQFSNSAIGQIWRNSVYKTVTQLIEENHYTDLQLIASKAIIQKKISDNLNEISMKMGRSISNTVLNISILNNARVVELGNLGNMDIIIEQITKLKDQGLPIEDAVKQVLINRGIIKSSESIYNIGGINELLSMFK